MEFVKNLVTKPTKFGHSKVKRERAATKNGVVIPKTNETLSSNNMSVTATEDDLKVE